ETPKDAEPKFGPQKRSVDEIRKAEKEVAQLKALYDAKHKELQAIGEKYHSALIRLKELQPDTKPGPQPKKDNIPAYEEKSHRPPGPSNKLPKGSDLENRLDQLQKQVEDLRLEIRRRQQKTSSPDLGRPEDEIPPTPALKKS